MRCLTGMAKNISFHATWSEAYRMAQSLRNSKLRYSVRQTPGKSNLAFFFPEVSISQYVYLCILFGTHR